MWEKTIQHINDLFKPRPEISEEKTVDRMQMIKMAIIELEQTINHSIEALSEAMNFHKNLSHQAEEFKIEAENWNAKAAEAFSLGEKNFGNKALENKSLAEGKHQEYLLMAKKSEQSVAELKMQLDKMKVHLAESKTKDALLSVEITGKTVHEELKLQIDTIPSPTEEKATINVGEPYEEKEIQKNIDTRNENAKTESKETLINKKVDDFFNDNYENPKESNNIEAQKKKIVEEFLKEDKKEANSKDKKQKRIDDFFNEE